MDEEKGSRLVDEEEALRRAAGLPSHLGTGGEVVETQSGGTSQWAHVLMGVASSSPPWFVCWMARVPALESSYHEMVMLKAGLPVEKERVRGRVIRT